MGAKPVLLRFDFPDLPPTRRTWWFMNEAGEVDLCPTDPGGEVDLFVTNPLETMTRPAYAQPGRA